MDKSKKMTLEQFIERAKQSKNDRKQFRVYESEILGALEVEKLSLERFATLIDQAVSDDEDSVSAAVRSDSQLVYHFVPIFRSKELQEAYGCDEPYNVVARVFDDNFGEIKKLSAFIGGMYGMGKTNEQEETDPVEELKN